MSRIKAKASPERTRKLIADERQHWEYLGADPDGFFYLCDKRQGPGYSRGCKTEAEARKQIEICIAIRVCEAIGLNAHGFDWHLWCDSAEQMVSEIVQRDKERRQASAEFAAFDAIIEAITRKR